MPVAWSRQHVSGFTEGLLRLLYPPACAYCGNAVEDESLCLTCQARLADGPEDRSCWRCAATVGPHAGTSKGCDQCTGERFAFEQVLRLGAYENDLKTACLRLKSLSGMRLGRALMQQMVLAHEKRLRDLGAEMVISVPLHWTRRLSRGYDQSAHLAEALATRLTLPVERRTLWRARRTPHQASVPFSERRRNVRDAFRARPNARVAGKSVLLVDDILTSGATCHAAARALKSAGARQVYVAVLARAASTSR